MFQINRTPQFVQHMFPKIIWTHSTKEILLTFDDGPDPVWTPKILQLLSNYGIKSIFFILGKHIKDDQLIAEIIDSGHEIGWHTQNHASFFKSSKNQIISELESRKHIEDKFEKKFRFFRFPYGHFFPWQIKYVYQQNLIPVMWTYMIHDYKHKSIEKLTNQLKNTKPNDILLLHDKNKNIEQTYLALKNCIEFGEVQFSKKINIAFSDDL